jgi:hypothetical protein
MKIILSRKGFDSKFGGYPSPILPDGTLLSLPIPDKNDEARYESLYYEGKSFAQIIEELTNGKFSHKNCHLDPDIRFLDMDISLSPFDWKPAFGQSGIAMTHLEKQKIKKNDLFLFFGFFREAEIIDGKYQYVKGCSPKHVIWGYLQIDKKILLPTKEKYPCLGMHPHLDKNDKLNNTIFVARDSLTWDNHKSGAGILKYKPELVLTKEGLSRSRWKLPDFLKDIKISYHSKDSWKENYFQSAHIGQEFVISADGNEEVEKWAKDLIRK